MKDHLLHHLSVFASRRAILMREEAQLWDVLAQDFKREARQLDKEPQTNSRRNAPPDLPSVIHPQKLLVGIAEASRMMGISRSTLYGEIAASRIEVKKAGKRSLISVSQINEWIKKLPTKA